MSYNVDVDERQGKSKSGSETMMLRGTILNREFYCKFGDCSSSSYISYYV